MWSSKPAQPASPSLMDTIFGNLYFRKLYHVMGGVMLISGMIFLEKKWFLISCAIYLSAFYLFSRRISFAVIGVMLLLILSKSIFITLGATIIWTVGDGLAGFTGLAFGRRKWSWHHQKTILGSAAFLSGSFLAMLVFLFISLGAPQFVLIQLALIPSLAATIVEIAPIDLIKDRKPDDNLLVILSSGLVLQILSIWIGANTMFLLEN